MLPNMEIRNCINCEKSLPLSQFSKSGLRRGKQDYNYRCKPCYAVHRERYRLLQIDKNKSGQIKIPLRKRCYRCKEVKSTKNFYVCMSTKGGIRNSCIPCSKELTRQSRIKTLRHRGKKQKYSDIEIQTTRKSGIWKTRKRRMHRPEGITF